MTYLSQLGRARRRRLHALMAANDSLRFFAAYIPGGVHTMIALARLSSDEKVRQVAFAWNALPRKEHRRANLDQLCRNAGLLPVSALGAIVDTGSELGMVSASELLGAVAALHGAAEAEVGRAMTGTWRDRERYFRSTGFLPGPNATAGQRDAYDPNSGLEPIEKENMEFTRTLKESQRRQLRQKGRG